MVQKLAILSEQAFQMAPNIAYQFQICKEFSFYVSLNVFLNVQTT